MLSFPCHQFLNRAPSRLFFPIIRLVFSHFNLSSSVPWCLMVQKLSSPPYCSLHPIFSHPIFSHCLPPCSTHFSSWWSAHSYLQIAFKLIRMGNRSGFFSKWKIHLSSEVSSADMTYELIRILRVPNGISPHKLSICCYYFPKSFSYILNMEEIIFTHRTDVLRKACTLVCQRTSSQQKPPQEKMPSSKRTY